MDLSFGAYKLQDHRGWLAQWKSIHFVNFCLHQTVAQNSLYAKSFSSMENINFLQIMFDIEASKNVGDLATLKKSTKFGKTFVDHPTFERKGT